jgi:hypothetical protein
MKRVQRKRSSKRLQDSDAMRNRKKVPLVVPPASYVLVSERVETQE